MEIRKGDRGMKRAVDMRKKGWTEMQGLMNRWRCWQMFDRRSGWMNGKMDVRGTEERRI